MREINKLAFDLPLMCTFSDSNGLGRVVCPEIDSLYIVDKLKKACEAIDDANDHEQEMSEAIEKLAADNFHLYAQLALLFKDNMKLESELAEIKEALEFLKEKENLREML